MSADQGLQGGNIPMKTWFRSLLTSALAFAAVNLLVSCDQRGKDHPAASSSGTSDSGGGTGIDGKVFESYIVNPANLPAFKYLKPLLENIKSENSGIPSDYTKIFKLKTWYIAPVELEKIGKETLGISFIKSSTQQIARQTTRAVWIDKKIYDIMEPQAQADLLLHEIVMNMYFFKFESIAEVCRNLMTVESKNSDSCPHASDLFDRAMPAEAMRPLNDQDNENIRFVTGWILQNAQQPILEKDFVRILFSKGFDKRLFNPENYGAKDAPPALKISGQEIFGAIKGTEVTGNNPDFCFGLTNNRMKYCRVEIEEVSKAFKFLTLAGYNLRIILQGEAPINIFFYAPGETSLSASRDEEGSVIYSLPLADWKEKVQINERLYSGFLLFRKSSLASQAGLLLDSLVIKPGIVVSIDKKRDPVCLVNAPKVNSLWDDAIVIRQKDSKLTSIQQTYLATPPFAACAESNVD